MSVLLLAAPAIGATIACVVLALSHHRFGASRAAWTCLVALCLPVAAILPLLAHFSIGAVVSIPQFGPRLHDIAHHEGIHTRPNWQLGIAALALFTFAIVRSARVVTEYRRLARESHSVSVSQESPQGLGLSREHSSIDIANDDSVFAHARPGRHAGITISRGALALLTPDEADAVIAHETCHRRHRHDLFLLAGSICTSIMPFLRPVFTRLVFSLERWADEEAAHRCHSKITVAQALTKMTTGLPLSRFALGASHVGIVARLTALTIDHPEASRSSWTYTALPVFAVAVFLIGLQWTQVVGAVLTVCSA
jgi:Zn-dependent protease with chaperone function